MEEKHATQTLSAINQAIAPALVVAEPLAAAALMALAQEPAAAA